MRAFSHNPSARTDGGIKVTEEEMMAHITSKPNVCGGRPCIRDTRIEIAVILDGLAEGMTEPSDIFVYRIRPVNPSSAHSPPKFILSFLSSGFSDRIKYFA